MKMTYHEAVAYAAQCRAQLAADPWWHARVALFYRMKLDVALLLIHTH